MAKIVTSPPLPDPKKNPYLRKPSFNTSPSISDIDPLISPYNGKNESSLNAEGGKKM